MAQDENNKARLYIDRDESSLILAYIQVFGERRKGKSGALTVVGHPKEAGKSYTMKATEML